MIQTMINDYYILRILNCLYIWIWRPIEQINPNLCVRVFGEEGKPTTKTDVAIAAKNSPQTNNRQRNWTHQDNNKQKHHIRTIIINPDEFKKFLAEEVRFV